MALVFVSLEARIAFAPKLHNAGSGPGTRPLGPLFLTLGKPPKTFSGSGGDEK
jgi:hypothetical protein